MWPECTEAYWRHYRLCTSMCVHILFLVHVYKNKTCMRTKTYVQEQRHAQEHTYKNKDIHTRNKTVMQLCTCIVQVLCTKLYVIVDDVGCTHKNKGDIHSTE